MAEKENLKSHMRSHSTSRERSTTAALQSSSQAPEYFSVQVVLVWNRFVIGWWLPLLDSRYSQ